MTCTYIIIPQNLACDMDLAYRRIHIVAAVFIPRRSFYKERIQLILLFLSPALLCMHLDFGIKLGQCSKPNFVSMTIIDDFIVVYGQKNFHTKSAIEGFAPVSKLVLILK